jgi:serine/threonine protein kinase
LEPDNFLVTASGHLKIADFGLATSGDWIYQESYRSNHRKTLLRRYHRSIISEGAEETIKKNVDDNIPQSHFMDSYIQKKMHADSVVGTYYYMAPEVLQGEQYNATADW